MASSKTLIFTLILICLTDFIWSDGCKCYNPVDDNKASDPNEMCGDTGRCFVKCKSKCTDKTVVDISNDDVKGKTTLCLSKLGCKKV